MSTSVRIVVVALVLFGAAQVAWNAIRARALKPYAGLSQPAGTVPAEPAADTCLGQTGARGQAEALRGDMVDSLPAASTPQSLLTKGPAGPATDAEARAPEVRQTPRPRYVASLGKAGSAAVAGARRGAKVLNVEPGERLPFALLGFNPELPTRVRQAGEQIGGEFSEVLEQQAGEQAISAGVWDSARASADEQFRALYGNEAFNQAGLDSAMDALVSRTAPGA